MSRGWKVFLAFALLAGAVLRLLWLDDMEYKSDEHYMFVRLARVGFDEAWPWLGVSSGVHIRNPGLSVWIFVALGKLFGVTTPLGLGRIVAALNVAALCLIVPFAWRFVEHASRKLWYWAAALAAVNPLAVMHHRKIWAQSVLPIFSLLFLAAWWKRGTARGAFFWGLIGALLGQIHMSGFFIALGFVVWGLLLDRPRIRWKPWFAGSVLGSLTLLPWLQHVASAPTGHAVTYGLGEIVQLKFWVFWITDALGLHLGKVLGVLNGNGTLEQLRDFLRYPLMGENPTWLTGLAHLGLVLAGAVVFCAAATKSKNALLSLSNFPKFFRVNETRFALAAALLGYGLLITLPGVMIYRFYLLITFPLEFVWLAAVAHKSRHGEKALAAVFVLQLFTSAAFLGYVHGHGGSERGDYGQAFRVGAHARDTVQSIRGQ